MMNWNPFPLQGNFDANNHFLNSLLGGFFIRLFQTDAMWVVRLSSVLSFPFYYWILIAFKRFFKHKNSFYFFVISLAGAPFILEFFSLARGYAVSWALLMMSIYFAAIYFDRAKIKHLVFSLVSSILAIYANLALIPSVLILAGLLSLKIFTNKNQRLHSLLLLGLFLFCLAYFVNYAFLLQSGGKLYLGADTDFLTITLASLAKYVWNLEGIWAKIFPFLISAYLFFNYLKNGLNWREFLKPKWLFHQLLFLSVIGLFVQNWLLGINFPEDRGAAHFLLFFLGSLALVFDAWEKQKWVNLFTGISVVFFFTNANFSHTQTYFYEHFDEELLSKIPTEVQGIPPSTGGRFWSMDNELSRIGKFPSRVFQNSSSAADTLQDYIITLKEFYPNFEKNYQIIHKDTISGLGLLERTKFLDRMKSIAKTSVFDGNFEYLNLLDQSLIRKGMIRCFGRVENLTFEHNLSIVLTQQDSSKLHQFVEFSPFTGCEMNEDGSVDFDLTFTALDFGKKTRLTFYLWNTGKLPLKGKLETEFYELRE